MATHEDLLPDSRLQLLPVGRARRRRMVPWPLLTVLALQSLVSVITLHNSAFQDEALYLYAGRQIIHHWGGGPAPLADYAYFISGYPDIYPPIGGFLDMIGGLSLARDFSLACMLGVTTIVYLVTGRLYGRRAAVFGAAIYSVLGVVLFLSRLATYDPLSLLLIAVAVGLAVYGGSAKRPWPVLGTGPAMVVAILAKYAALLFVPAALALVACVAFGYGGWRRALARLPLAFASLAGSAIVAYELMDHAAFHAISGSTTNRAVGAKSPRLDLLLHVLQLGGPVYLIALGGLLLALRLRRRFRMIAVVLFGGSWLVPAYHVYMQEPISLDKHIGYAMFFAAPLAGYALAWLSEGEWGPRIIAHRGEWVAAVAAIAVVATLGLIQARNLYDGWPDTSTLSAALHAQLRDGSGRILAEDIEVSQFDALDVTEPWQWESFYYPYYLDHARKPLYGQPAIAQAIKDRYYNWVELSFIYLPDQAYYAAGQMARTRNYDLVDVILFGDSYGQAHFYLFRSAPTPGQGNFTSLAQLKTRDWGS
jgi:hypothetical protein